MDKTSLMIVLYLEFDNDTDMSQITKEIGLVPTECKNKKERKKNTFSNDNLPAFWSISTGYIETFDLEEVTALMLNKIEPFLGKIRDALYKYNGEADFCIVTKVVEVVPAIYYNREFLNALNYLDATMQMDMYVNNINLIFD